jgi:hypothetical protein
VKLPDIVVRRKGQLRRIEEILIDGVPLPKLPVVKVEAIPHEHGEYPRLRLEIVYGHFEDLESLT